MIAFFQGQMDFIYFLYGLGFFAAGIIASFLFREKIRGLPWFWLMLFCLGHSLNEWLEMPTTIFSGNAYYAALRTLVLLASFFCLFEFGRRSLRSIGRRIFGWWLTVVLGLAALSFYQVGGWSAVDIHVRYFLGVTGSLLAARAFSLIGRAKDEADRRYYRVFSWGFGLYALSQCFGPQGQSWPASFLNSASFLSFFHFPVQLLRTMLAAAFFTALWWLWLDQDRATGERYSRRRNSLFTLMSLSLIFVLAWGWVITQYAGRLGEEQINDRILDSARIAAASLDLAAVAQLYGTPEDLERPAYAGIKAKLVQLDQAAGDFHFAYLSAWRGGTLVILADSKDPGSPEYSPPGQVYGEAPPEFRKAFSAGQETVTRPYRDRWGQWVSGLMPLKDPGSGLTFAVFGLDYPGVHWQADIAATRLIAIGTTLVICLILIGSFVFSQFSSEATRRIAITAEELKFRNLLLATEQETAPDGILVVGADGQIISHNRRFAEMWQIPTGVLAARSDEQALKYINDSLADPKEFTAKVDYLYQHPQESSFDQVRLKDGRVFDRYSTALIGAAGQYQGRIWYFRDMTDREIAEDQIKRTRDLLNETGKMAKVGGWEFDVETKKQIWTEAVYQIHEIDPGFQPDVAKGLDFYHPMDRPIIEQAVREAVEAGKPFDVELRIITAKDNIRWVHAVGRAIRQEGKVIKVAGTFQDITERKLTEEALRQSQARYQGIYDQSPIGIELYDKTGALLDVNPACLEVFGLTNISDVKGFKLFEDPNISEPMRQKLRRGESLTYEAPFDFELIREAQLYPTSRRGKIWLSVSISPLRENDKISGYLVQLQDITARYRAQELLQQSEAKYRLVAENIVDVIWILDLETGRFRYVSPSVQRLRGYTPEEVMAQPMAKALTPESYQTLMQVLPTAIAEFQKGTLKTYVNEIAQPRKDGTIVQTETAVNFNLNKETGRLEAFGVSRDITERKKAEAAIQESEAKFRNIFEHSNDVITYVDTRGKILDVNDRVKEVIGYEPREIIGKNFTDLNLIQLKDAPKLLKLFAETVLKGQPQTLLELELKRKDGSLVAVEVGTQFIKRDGRVQAIINIFRDVTEHKRILESLRQSEEKYRRMFENSEVGMYRSKADGSGVLDVNRTYARIVGFSREEIIAGTALARWAKPEKRDEFIRRLKDKGAIVDYEIELLKKDGGTATCLCSAVLYPEAGIIEGSIIDISERKNLEMLVLDQKERLSVTLHSIGDGVIATDPAGLVTLVNEVAERLTGWKNDEATGRRFDEVFHIVSEQTRQRCPDPVEQVIRTGRPVTLGDHTLLIGKNGQERPIDDSAAPIKDAAGRIIGVVLVFRDVTDKRRAEAELRQAKDYAENIIRSANVMIVGLDLAGNVTVFNEEAERLTGYSQEEMLEKNWFKTVVPSDRYPEVWREFARMKAEGRIVRAFVNPILTKHGEVKIVSWQNSELREGDKIVGTLSFGVDVTERQHDEMEIRRLSRAIEQGPAIVVITDTEGDIQYVNPKFTEVTGYELKEVIGQNSRILKSGELPAEVYRELWRTIKAGGEWRGEFHNKKKNGQLYWEYASISPIKNAKGEIVNYLAVKEDITERKRLEKIKDDFVSTVSHELRTPLSIIHEGVAQVDEGIHGPVSERQRHFLGFTLEAIGRLTRIIDNLLDISRLDAGKVKVHLQPADLAALTQGVCRSFKVLADNKGLELREYYRPDKIEMPLDRDQVVQVFTNLIGNAVKFTSRGYIEVSVVDNGDHVTCCVLDTGPGIAPENLPKLFSKFEQFGRTPGSGEKGTGLGLAIAKGIVEQHGGHIWVESVFGSGSKFIFTLPKQ